MIIEQTEVVFPSVENIPDIKILEDNKAKGSNGKLVFKHSAYNTISYNDYEYQTAFEGNSNILILRTFEKIASCNNGDVDNVESRLKIFGTKIIDDKLRETLPRDFINNTLEMNNGLEYRFDKKTYSHGDIKYIVGLENNVIKTTCIEQDLTYQQLADAIGVSESSLRSSASTGNVSNQVKKSIEMHIKIIHLERELAKSNQIKSILKSWLN